MNISNVIYIAPEIPMKGFDIKDKEKVLEAFKKRIDYYYFVPLKLLNEGKHAFLTGMIIVSLIDIFARYQDESEIDNNNRYRNFLKNEFGWEYFKAEKFYENYRCGLLHEGHLKANAEISYTAHHEIFADRINGLYRMIINPEKLEKSLLNYFEKYMYKLKENEERKYEIFIQIFIKDFGEEIEFFGKINNDR